MAVDLSGIPQRPVLGHSGPNGEATPEDRLKFDDDRQAYWFAINNIQNQQNQDALTKSNMQKASHDAMMEVARNLK